MVGLDVSVDGSIWDPSEVVSIKVGIVTDHIVVEPDEVFSKNLVNRITVLVFQVVRIIIFV